MIVWLLYIQLLNLVLKEAENCFSQDVTFNLYCRIFLPETVLDLRIVDLHEIFCDEFTKWIKKHLTFFNSELV